MVAVGTPLRFAPTAPTNTNTRSVDTPLRFVSTLRNKTHYNRNPPVPPSAGAPGYKHRHAPAVAGLRYIFFVSSVSSTRAGRRGHSAALRVHPARAGAFRNGARNPPFPGHHPLRARGSAPTRTLGWASRPLRHYMLRVRVRFPYGARTPAAPDHRP